MVNRPPTTSIEPLRNRDIEANVTDARGAFRPGDRGAGLSQEAVNECRGSITGAVGLIREHLEDEASRVAAGDFDDPAAIHGDDMPGLTTLRDGAAEIDIQLEQLDDGARLV